MKQTIFIFILAFTINHVNSQSYLGGHFSTKEAILSNSLNPAAGIAGDMKWQTNLFGFSTEVGNNYFSINGKQKVSQKIGTKINMLAKA